MIVSTKNTTSESEDVWGYISAPRLGAASDVSQPKPTLLVFIPCPRMLALHARGALDNPCGYTTSASLCRLESTLIASVNSGTHEDLAHHGWYLYVGLLALPTLQNIMCPKMSNWQLGVRHQSWLRVGCHPRTSFSSVDDMGT